VETRYQPMRLAVMLAVVAATGCADLVGADFDNVHPRSPTKELDAAESSDSPKNEGTGGNANPPGANADASDGRGSADDVAPDPGAGSGSDAMGIGPRSDATGGIDARDAGNANVVDAARDAELDGSRTADAVDATDLVDAVGGGHWGHDGNGSDAGDDGDATHGDDVLDAGSETRPDGPRTTVVTGRFVTLGVPPGIFSTIQLRGHFISNATVRGVTSTGISIEGNLQ